MVQSTNQGYPTVHRALASLVRQLGLVGGRGPGFTEVAGQAGNGTVYWSMISRCGGNMDYVHQPLLPRGDCSSTLTTDGVLGLALLYGNHSFKPWFVCFFSCAPAQPELVWAWDLAPVEVNWFRCADPTPVCTLNVGWRQHKFCHCPVPLTQRFNYIMKSDSKSSNKSNININPEVKIVISIPN